jgi:DNA-binding MarR family transcriptional regulator
MTVMPKTVAPEAEARGAPHAGRNLLFLREEELRLAQDLLFFGYRDFTAVGRRPGITVGELLGILSITKQSLGRVLTPLVEDGYVTQATGQADRRQRLLSLTEKGAALERRLYERQRETVMSAYREAGPQAVEGFRRVMRGLMGPEARAALARLEAALEEAT